MKKSELKALIREVAQTMISEEHDDTVLAKPIKISDLINKLSEINRKHGNLPVVIDEDGGYEFANGIRLVYPDGKNGGYEYDKPPTSVTVISRNHVKSSDL